MVGMYRQGGIPSPQRMLPTSHPLAMRELEASPDPTSWYEGKCLIAITGQYPVMEGLNPLCSQQYNAPGSSESIAEKAIMKYSAPTQASQSSNGTGCRSPRQVSVLDLIPALPAGLCTVEAGAEKFVTEHGAKELSLESRRHSAVSPAGEDNSVSSRADKLIILPCRKNSTNACVVWHGATCNASLCRPVSCSRKENPETRERMRG